MGKASAKKKQRSPQDRRQTSAERAVRSYFSRVGVAQPSNQGQLWAGIESRMGQSFTMELDQAMSERESNMADPAVYELLYRDIEAFQATLPLLAPMAKEWLTRFAALELPEGDLLDLGSGPGFYACFYALQRPDSTVVGVEASPAGVALGCELAARLGVENVEFIHGDIKGLHLGRQFAVVCSTAMLVEVDGEKSDVSSPFSSLRSGRELFDSQQSELAKLAAAHLNSDGSYVSLERLPHFEDYARWIGAQLRAGLVVDLSEISRLRWRGPVWGDESMPVMVGRPAGSPPTFEDVLDWQLARPPGESDDSLQVECSIAFATDVQFVRGQHFDVRDGDGDGKTRLYLFIVDGDAVLYMATSRGARMIQGRVPEPRYRPTRGRVRVDPRAVRAGTSGDRERGTLEI